MILFNLVLSAVQPTSHTRRVEDPLETATSILEEVAQSDPAIIQGLDHAIIEVKEDKDQHDKLNIIWKEKKNDETKIIFQKQFATDDMLKVLGIDLSKDNGNDATDAKYLQRVRDEFKNRVKNRKGPKSQGELFDKLNDNDTGRDGAIKSIASQTDSDDGSSPIPKKQRSDNHGEGSDKALIKHGEGKDATSVVVSLRGKADQNENKHFIIKWESNEAFQKNGRPSFKKKYTHYQLAEVMHKQTDTVGKTGVTLDDVRTYIRSRLDQGGQEKLYDALLIGSDISSFKEHHTK